MGKVTALDTVEQIVAALTPDNPFADRGALTMYANAYLTYRLATANIAEHGVIVAHPRTGSPIENPYLKVQTSQLKIMQGLGQVRKSDALWR